MSEQTIRTEEYVVSGDKLVAKVIPTWAAIGAIAALVADLRIVVEKVRDDNADEGAASKPTASETLPAEAAAVQ